MSEMLSLTNELNSILSELFKVNEPIRNDIGSDDDLNVEEFKTYDAGLNMLQNDQRFSSSSYTLVHKAE